MTDKRYGGYANRETWAFNLHWQNDESLYLRTLEDARNHLRYTNPDASDSELGAVAVNLWRDTIATWTAETGTLLPGVLALMSNEVGSWWRIDTTEVGATIREALDLEDTQ